MDISYLSLFFSLLLLIIPIAIFLNLKLKLLKQLFVSFGRMVVQLALIGLWLQFIFGKDDIRFTLFWVCVMLANAVMILRGRLKFQRKILTPIFIISLFITTITILPWLIFVVVRPTPLFNASFLIPIYGMLLGNSMNGSAQALERFESNLTGNLKAYHTRLSLGASLWEAALPIFRQAMHASLLPQLLNVAAMGIVSLPGMMSGQILGGASPLVAIKYQIMMMTAIFSGVALTDYVAIRLYLKKRFDRYYLLKG